MNIDYTPPPKRSPWIGIIEESERVFHLSKSIQQMIHMAYCKAQDQTGDEHPNSVLLGHSEYAALKKSIEDSNFMYCDHTSLTDAFIFNGLTVLEVHKPGITIAKIYNT